jgi:asparagine synthase (glutamine-hydrolysing)
VCGVAGIRLCEPTRPQVELDAAAAAMAHAIRHRGPDSWGTWADAATGVALGHRRLAVIDLSEAGAQPMTSADTRWVLTYNGEIYNHQHLADRLHKEGVRLRGTSDSEVLVEAIARWGVERTLDRLDGMFAFAVWDRQERALTLARDRIGEKPLYYGELEGRLLFASELRAILVGATSEPSIDHDSVADLLRHKYVPEPWSIYHGIKKLPPGCTVTAGLGRSWDPPRTYWSAIEVAAAGLASPLTCSEDEGLALLDTALTESVRRRMIADVPLGAFLSGGIDSSAVVAAMRQATSGTIRTFTIGVADAQYDESRDAALVAAHLGTEHTELRVSEADILDVVPRLPELYDEPFADSSQIPTYLVSRLARQHVTVALSGDGGDELFGGYNRHTWAPTIWRSLKRIPAVVRAPLGRVALRAPTSHYDRAAAAASRFVPRLDQRYPGQKVHKLARALAASDSADLYDRLVAHWDQPETVVREGQTRIRTPIELPDGSLTELLMLRDLVEYLPGDILTKLDRASMAVSLETRVPFLAPDLVALAWRMPLTWKVQGSTGKRILRRFVAQHMPPELFDRPKAGFGVPVGTWLRGPLREWAEDLLSPASLGDHGLFEPRPIRQRWQAHLAGEDHQYELWDVLMLQSWLSAPSRPVGVGAAADVR